MFTHFIVGSSNTAFEYRHAAINNKQFAKLLDLEGSRKDRIDLCRPGMALVKQFKVVSLSRLRQNQLISEIINSTTKLPVLNIFDKTRVLSNKWQLTWLPSGFLEKSHLPIDYKKRTLTHVFTLMAFFHLP